MKRAEFFQTIIKKCQNELPFKMTYKKKNGELRKALCKLKNEDFDKNFVKGTGFNREHKIKDWKAFQYWDLEKNMYRTAKLDNIIDVTINEETETIVD